MSLEENVRKQNERMDEADRKALAMEKLKGRNITPMPGLVMYSDDHLATVFVSHCLEEFRYTGSDHNQWLRWDGKRWVADTRLMRLTRAREICRQIAATAEKESEQRNLASAKMVASITNLARSDQRLALDKDRLDFDPYLLNTPAGTYHLRTGERHKHNPDDLITKMTRYSPEEGGCPVFEGFLSDVFLGDKELIDFMQVSLGYCLTGIIQEQVFFFAHGGGKNGKSTLFDVIEEILDDYANNLSATALMSQRGSQHSTDIAMLEGVRTAFTTELDKSQRWNIPVLKSLTGNHRISARRMKKDASSFPNRVKLIISGNDLPSFEGGDAAMERRILLIPFNAYFSEEKRDKEMPAKLIKEAPQIMQWLMDGARRYFEEGLVIPEQVKSNSARYFEEMDTVKSWAEICLTEQKDGFLSSTELLEHYQKWGEDEQMSAREFKKHMIRLGYKWKRGRQARGFEGVTFQSTYGE